MGSVVRILVGGVVILWIVILLTYAIDWRLRESKRRTEFFDRCLLDTTEGIVHSRDYCEALYRRDYKNQP